jgi:microcin C transport system ATP-binding protein
VMEKGVLVESAATETLFDAPQHPYTQKLLASEPQRQIEPVASNARRVMEVQGLCVDYGTNGLFGRKAFRALHCIDLALRHGETLGVVGESGSGKSTLAATLLALQQPAAGSIHIDGMPLSTLRTASSRKALHAKLQVVFQDPFGSLSPRMTVEQIVGEGLRVHRPELDAQARRERVAALLHEVGMPWDVMLSYPQEFSGGQRQRIAIARALAVEPDILILDEPTSALDVSIQKQVLSLLANLQKKRSLSYLFITHDLAVIRAMAHRVMVMKSGHVVESGETSDVLDAPTHPYTRNLVAASMMSSVDVAA